jgi:phosphatidylserine decarboxylase
MDDRLFISALRMLPKNALSRAAGALTRWRAPAPVRLAAMKAFARRYGIDLSESPDLEIYRTFGEFFARPLRPGLRPIAPGETTPVSPVDAAVSEVGVAAGGRLVQAKGIDYTAAALLADERLAARLEGGAYATLYLSPKDYHRIHFPLGGGVVGWRYVPGRLWPVNAASVRTVPGLFAVNERLVTVMDTPLGRCAVHCNCRDLGPCRPRAANEEPAPA